MRNLLGLISHPYLTLRAVRGEKDYSQTFFLLGFPFYLWLPVAFVFIVFELLNFFFLKIPWQWHRLILATFGLITLVLVMIEAYIAYWVFIYFKLKKKLSEKQAR